MTDITTIYQRDFVVCPACGEESGCRIDHLYGEQRPFGPWVCAACKGWFSGYVNDKSVRLAVDKTRLKITRSLALLRLDSANGPLFFVFEHDRYGDDNNEANQEHQRYYFEEHSCPTNWLGECVAVVEEGREDPHGIMRFVRAADVPIDFDTDTADYCAIFPEVLEATTQQ